MRAYAAQGPNATGTANKTGLTIISTTAVRPRLFDFCIGSSATPADQAAQFNVQRFTAAGTAASNPTATILDAADVAAVATAGITHSVEPTYTANTVLKQISMNQRATFRYVCSPGYEFVAPATAANGIGLYLLAATATSIYNFDASWFE